MYAAFNGTCPTYVETSITVFSAQTCSFGATVCYFWNFLVSATMTNPKTVVALKQVSRNLTITIIIFPTNLRRGKRFYCFFLNHFFFQQGNPFFMRFAQETSFNPLNPELIPICCLLALLGANHFLHFNRIKVKSLTLRPLMSYIYGAPILDVSRSHTTTHHSR